MLRLLFQRQKCGLNKGEVHDAFGIVVKEGVLFVASEITEKAG